MKNITFFAYFFCVLFFVILMLLVLIFLERTYKLLPYSSLGLTLVFILLLSYMVAVKVRKTAVLNISDDPKYINKRTKYFAVGYVIVIVPVIFLLLPYFKTYAFYVACTSAYTQIYSDSGKLHSLCSCRAQAYVAADVNPGDFKTVQGRAKQVAAGKSCMDRYYEPVFVDDCMKKIKGENSFFKTESATGCRCLYRKDSEIYIQTGSMEDPDHENFKQCLDNVTFKNAYYAVCMEKSSATFPDFRGPQSSLESFCGCFAEKVQKTFHDSYDSSNRQHKEAAYTIKYQCWESHLAPYQSPP